MPPIQEFYDKLHSTNVTVKVGGGQGSPVRDFSIPRDLLCARSTWFDSALNGGRFQEGATGVIKLPTDDPTIFEAVHYYIYFQDLAFPGISDSDPTNNPELQLKYCLEIWRIADKFNMAGLQNRAMLRACEVLKWYHGVFEIPISTLKACFELTLAYSPLRSIAIDHIVMRTEAEGESIRSFRDALAVLDVDGMAQLYETVSEYHEQFKEDWPHDFPRYLKPIKFKPTFYVPELKEKQQGQRPSSQEVENGYSNWTDLRPTCVQCGLFDGDSTCDVCYYRSSQCSCGCYDDSLICRRCAGK